MTTNALPIQADPVITKLLDKVPADMRGSFSPEQLLALKVALGGRMLSGICMWMQFWGGLWRGWSTIKNGTRRCRDAC